MMQDFLFNALSVLYFCMVVGSFALMQILIIRAKEHQEVLFLVSLMIVTFLISLPFVLLTMISA
jgi:hypothetical protein